MLHGSECIKSSLAVAIAQLCETHFLDSRAWQTKINAMTKPTLLVLAAGMGSRYGGLKQIDPVGPSGETIIDYSIFDAMRAGFGKLVFVIRKTLTAVPRNRSARVLEKRIAVDLRLSGARQTSRPYTLPAGRTKPWGTTHAILMAADIIKNLLLPSTPMIFTAKRLTKFSRNI